MKKTVSCLVLASFVATQVSFPGRAQAGWLSNVGFGIAGYLTGRYVAGGGGSGGGGVSYYSDVYNSTANVYIDTKPIQVGLEKVAKAINATALTPEERERMRKYYHMDEVGPLIGVNIDSASAGTFVRNHGLETYQKVIEDRVMNMKINSVMSGAALLGLKREKDLTTESIRDPQAESLAKTVKAIGDPQIVFNMIDLVRRRPNASIKQLMAELEARPENPYMREKKNIFPIENGMSEQSSLHLKEFLLYAIKKDLAGGGLNFNGLTYDNVDSNVDVVIANANHLKKTIEELLKNSDRLSKTYADADLQCQAALGTLAKVEVLQDERTAYRYRGLSKVDLEREKYYLAETAKANQLLGNALNPQSFREGRLFLESFSGGKAIEQRFTQDVAALMSNQWGRLSKEEAERRAAIWKANRAQSVLSEIKVGSLPTVKSSCESIKVIREGLSDQSAFLALDGIVKQVDVAQAVIRAPATLPQEVGTPQAFNGVKTSGFGNSASVKALEASLQDAAASGK